MIEEPALGLMFALGLRHGLDPDHIAIIDNLVFVTADRRPRLAPWVGTIFALGHSVAFVSIALIVAAVAGTLTPPGWLRPVTDALVIALLIAVGTANMLALMQEGVYRPLGWRSVLLSKRLSRGAGAASILMVGLVFGLVFDTITQAAAWGAAAAARGGTGTTMLLTSSFSSGMLLVDTIDSHVVTRVLRSMRREGVDRFRRAVGWLIVALSFGTVAYILLVSASSITELPEAALTAVGSASLAAIVTVLFWSRRSDVAPVT